MERASVGALGGLDVAEVYIASVDVTATNGSLLLYTPHAPVDDGAVVLSLTRKALKPSRAEKVFAA